MDNVRPEEMDFRDVDFSDVEVLKCNLLRRRRCPVMITLAEPDITPVDIQKMLEAGMNGVTFKMSFSTRGDKVRFLGKVDKAAMKCCEKYGVNNWPVATSISLKTCIVKTGMLEHDIEYVLITEGKEVTLTSNIQECNKCNESKIFVDNHYMASDVKVGTEISINADGIILVCKQIVDENNIICIVTKGGKLYNLCNVSARSVKHSRPYLSKTDLEIIKFALEYQVDIIVINYPRHVDTLKKVKQFISNKTKRPLLISGICTQQCLDNFDDIMKESDGIILSREYLPYELESSKGNRLSRIQKWMAAKCMQAGKPLIVSGVFQKALATGIFDDAEISDVTNTILDGASGFLLKDCYKTDYVLRVLNAFKHLCYNVEPLVTSKQGFWRIVDEPQMPLNAAEATVMSCAAMANHTNATLVLIPTVTGRTIKALNLMRLSCIIITISSDVRITRLLEMYRGVQPLLYTGITPKRWHKKVEARLQFAIEFAVKRSWVSYGDTYVTLERHSESSSFCDTVKAFKITTGKKSLVECEVDED